VALANPPGNALPWSGTVYVFVDPFVHPLLKKVWGNPFWVNFKQIKILVLSLEDWSWHFYLRTCCFPTLEDFLSSCSSKLVAFKKIHNREGILTIFCIKVMSRYERL